MTIQTLELRLDDITAADYLAWCVDPEPPALGLGLRAVALEAEPLGDTVRATLHWEGPAPAPTAAVRAAGLPALGVVRELRARFAPPAAPTWAAAA